MIDGRIEAADLVDGHTAQRLYDLQKDPVRYQEYWSRLQKEANALNKQADLRDSTT